MYHCNVEVTHWIRSNSVDLTLTRRFNLLVKISIIVLKLERRVNEYVYWFESYTLNTFRFLWFKSNTLQVQIGRVLTTFNL